jgi:hypothetical protein
MSRQSRLMSRLSRLMSRLSRLMRRLMSNLHSDFILLFILLLI